MNELLLNSFPMKNSMQIFVCKYQLILNQFKQFTYVSFVLKWYLTWINMTISRCKSLAKKCGSFSKILVSSLSYIWAERTTMGVGRSGVIKRSPRQNICDILYIIRSEHVRVQDARPSMLLTLSSCMPHIHTFDGTWNAERSEKQKQLIPHRFLQTTHEERMRNVHHFRATGTPKHKQHIITYDIWGKKQNAHTWTLSKMKKQFI